MRSKEMGIRILAPRPHVREVGGFSGHISPPPGSRDGCPTNAHGHSGSFVVQASRLHVRPGRPHHSSSRASRGGLWGTRLACRAGGLGLNSFPQPPGSRDGCPTNAHGHSGSFVVQASRLHVRPGRPHHSSSRASRGGLWGTRLACRAGGRELNSFPQPPGSRDGCANGYAGTGGCPTNAHGHSGSFVVQASRLHVRPGRPHHSSSRASRGGLWGTRLACRAGG